MEIRLSEELLQPQPPFICNRTSGDAGMIPDGVYEMHKLYRTGDMWKKLDVLGGEGQGCLGARGPLEEGYSRTRGALRGLGVSAGVFWY